VKCKNIAGALLLGFSMNAYSGVCYDFKATHEVNFKSCKNQVKDGNPLDQLILAAMYDKGKGTPKNNKKAFVWYKKAANQGLADAQNYLAFMYEQGRGTDQDYRKAIKWYKKAAEHGYANTQYNLALMYHQGRGTNQDYKKAIKWYKKSAKQGYTDAQYNLALMYAKGQGTPESLVLAPMYYNIAAANRDKLSVKLRKEVSSKMSHSQITKAQSLAKKWMDRFKNEKH